MWARSCLSNRKSCQSKLTFVRLVCASPGHSLSQYLAGKQHLVHRREAIMNFNESINSTTITKIISHLAILTIHNFNISHNTYNDRKEWILVFLSFLSLLRHSSVSNMKSALICFLQYFSTFISFFTYFTNHTIGFLYTLICLKLEITSNTHINKSSTASNSLHIHTGSKFSYPIIHRGAKA